MCFLICSDADIDFETLRPMRKRKSWQKAHLLEEVLGMSLLFVDLICCPSISSEASTDKWNGSAAPLFAMEGARSCGKKYMYCRRKFLFWTCAVSFWNKTPLLQTAIWTPLLPVLKIAFYNISNAESRQNIWLARRALAKGKLWQKCLLPCFFVQCRSSDTLSAVMQSDHYRALSLACLWANFLLFQLDDLGHSGNLILIELSF